MCAQCRYDPRGSMWNRWDLHFHTPSSYDYQCPILSNQDIVDVLVGNGVQVVGVTDHHKIDVQRIKELQALGSGKLTVLPGIELRDSHGGKPIHYICLFPEDCDLDHVWRTLEGTLGLTNHSVQQKGGDDVVYVTIETGAPLARSLGGVVSIHAGEKANSIENISNREQFQQRIKYDITKAHVDLMEIGQLKDIHAYHDKVFPQTGLDKPLIIGSDCHDASKYAVRSVTWVRADPTFRGLLMTLREPRDRVFIGDRPLQAERIEQNPTKYIRSVSFSRKGEAPETEHWFNGEVVFNLGLVAIIGNKGSGKSALSDSIGLLGSTRNSDSFSFLCKERFCHPVAGHSQYYDATLKWVSGEEITRCLDEAIGPDEIERLKYLPQNHVDKVCNELVELGESNFEQELGAVIFSHVPDAQRLGCASLAELIDFMEQ